MTFRRLFQLQGIYSTLRTILKAFALTSIWLALLAMLTSCDSDPFGRNKKKVAGDYLLEYFGEGGDAYYLVRKGTDTQGGVFEAVIEEIGWSKDYIVCKVKKQFSTDVDGIYSLAVSNGKVEGPFSPSSLASDARFKGIKLEDVRKVYDRL